MRKPKALFKKFYAPLSLREKVLLSAFIWICLIIGLSVTLGKINDTRKEFLTTANTWNMQDLWLENEDLISEELSENLERLDSSKTYSRDRLIGWVDSVARQSKIQYDIEAPQTQDSEIFNVHSIRLSIRNASIKDLIALDQKIKERSPYLGLDEIKITPNRLDPAKLGAQMIISSFELKQQTL